MSSFTKSLWYILIFFSFPCFWTKALLLFLSFFWHIKYLGGGRGVCGIVIHFSSCCTTVPLGSSGGLCHSACAASPALHNRESALHLPTPKYIEINLLESHYIFSFAFLLLLSVASSKVSWSVPVITSTCFSVWDSSIKPNSLFCHLYFPPFSRTMSIGDEGFSFTQNSLN